MYLRAFFLAVIAVVALIYGATWSLYTFTIATFIVGVAVSFISGIPADVAWILTASVVILFMAIIVTISAIRGAPKYFS